MSPVNGLPAPRFVFPDPALPPTIPSIEPSEFAAGESVQWTRSVGDYAAADGYVVTWYFRGAGVADVVGNASGSVWTATLTPTQTKDLAPGAYTWRAYAEKRDGATVNERHFIAEGRTVVLPDFAAATAGDSLSHAEKMLAAIDAVLEGRITADVEAYQIGGRSVTKIPFAELRKARNLYVSAVRRERTRTFGTTVRVNFGQRPQALTLLDLNGGRLGNGY